jgi:hypothetical protein
MRLSDIVDQVRKHKGPLFVAFDGKDFEGTVRVYKADLIEQLLKSGKLTSNSEFYISVHGGNMFVFRND